MLHRSTRDVVDDLRRGGRLVVCDAEVDPRLEVAEIQRRVYASRGPAVFFPNVRGCRFPLVSNLFGSADQARYMFRHTWRQVQQLIEIKRDPASALRRPWQLWRVPWTALRMLPRGVRRGAVQQHRASIADLPGIVSWPEDGGPFVTLPQVLSQFPGATGNRQLNLGMYRVQLRGNQYGDHECGLHYQIRRGIGAHHLAALRAQRPLEVSVTVGGHPAMTLAAVMPLPEGLSELTFAGALAGRRIPMIHGDHAPVYADADFAIVGQVHPEHTKPEGPFGDHLGYYSLQHSFPVLSIKHVWHRDDAVWPFTVVGRPPQEDSTFGELIHELTGPLIPEVLPGIHAVHAVDAAGVHPLLLAIGSERNMPFLPRTEPQELLTQAHAVLGNGQLSLAKYLLIVNHADDDQLDIHDTAAFFRHVLQRADWKRDLHFETRTSIDTLDYSGDGLNRGSKLVIAAVGAPRYRLAESLHETATSEEETARHREFKLPDGWTSPRVIAPGILAVEGPTLREKPPDVARQMQRDEEQRVAALPADHPMNAFRLVVLCDDSAFASHSFENFLWITFTRSQPSTDVWGLAASTVDKHWGCAGALVIDARIKPHHAPAVEVDREVARRVDALASRGGTLAKYL